MENTPRKSKALIITIIVIIFLVVVSYLLFKNRDMFGIKTSNSIARIFAPLITSENEKNISKIDENSVRTLAQAGEDLKKGDNVTRFGTNADNNPIVLKAKPGDEIFGFAGNDIGSGDVGEIITNNNGANTFWNSFFNLIGGVFGTNGNNGGGNGGNGDLTRQCSDTLDNDNDGLIDTSDPECHTDGDATNPLSYDPEHYSEKLGAGGNEEDGTPDLTASSVTPTTASINVPVNLTTIITNIGDGSTGFNFVSFFQIIKDSNINVEDNETTTISKLNIKNIFVKIFNKISLIKKAVALTGDINTSNGIEITAVVPTLTTQKSNVTSVSYTFSSTGVYKIRACADKKSISDIGTVEESNEENNCSGWTTLTVSGSLPPPGDDDIIIPDDDTTITEPPIEIVTPENKCLLIEQNPLVFTDAEKAKLAELLRKFYLISSTLKTEEDIITVYSEIDQYKNFIAQTDGLIDTCYKEVAAVKAKGGGFGWVQNGNPWYRKEFGGSASFGGDYPYVNYNILEGNYTCDNNGYCYTPVGINSDTGPGCKAVSGYYYGTLVKDPFKFNPALTGSAGDDCNDYNKPFKCNAINSNLYGNSNDGPDQNLLNAGCKWKEGVYLDGVERVLEMW